METINRFMKDSEIMQGDAKALIRALGPMEMAHYLEKYDGGGSGDYTVEKYQQKEMTINEIVQMK